MPISKREKRMERRQKVGSLIDDDRRRKRKQLATVTLYKPNNVRIKSNKLKTYTKIKL